MSKPDPREQDEAITLEAELRQALQHRHAALCRAEEARRELEAAIERAKRILARARLH